MNLNGTEPIRYFGGIKPAFEIWEEGKYGLEHEVKIWPESYHVAKDLLIPGDGNHSRLWILVPASLTRFTVSARMGSGNP
jgi:hypothetical protein